MVFFSLSSHSLCAEYCLWFILCDECLTIWTSLFPSCSSFSFFSSSSSLYVVLLCNWTRNLPDGTLFLAWQVDVFFYFWDSTKVLDQRTNQTVFFDSGLSVERPTNVRRWHIQSWVHMQRTQYFLYCDGFCTYAAAYVLLDYESQNDKSPENCMRCFLVRNSYFLL